MSQLLQTWHWRTSSGKKEEDGGGGGDSWKT